MAFKLISFGVRAGIAGGFIYWTKEQGLWGDANQATQFYKKAYAETANLIGDVPIEVPSVPKPNEISAFLRVNWNKAVYATFDGLVAAPQKLGEWSIKGWESAVNLLNEPPQPVKES